MSFRLSLCAVAFCLLIAPFVNAQPVRMTGITGGHVVGFETYHDTVYATSGDYSGGNIFRTTNFGESWESLAANLPQSTVVSTFALEQGWMLAGTRAGLFLSSDIGQHWRKADSSLPYGAIDALLANDTELVLSDWPNGVYTAASVTGRWTKTLDLKRQAHGMLRHHGRIFIATQGEGVYAAETGAGPWKNIKAGFIGNGSYVMALMEFHGVLYAGTIEGGYAFDDATETWTQLPAFSSQSIMAFATDGELLYANDGVGGLYSSKDAKAWRLISTGLPEFMETRGLASAGGFIFTASSRDGVFRASSANVLWSRASEGINNLSIARVLTFPSHSGGSMLIAGGDDADFGVAWISSDNGDSWRSCQNLTNRGFHDFGYNGGKLFAASDGEGLFVSMDDGTSWKNTGIQSTYPTTICATRDALLTGTSGATMGVLRSTDNGATWNSATTNIPGANVDHIVYDSVSETAFAGTGGVGYYASHDQGDTWEMQSEEGPTALTGVVRIGAALVAGDLKGIFTSTNDGATWSHNDAAPGRVYAVERLGDAVLAASQNRVYISNNAGASWTLYDSLPVSAVIRSIALDSRFVYYGTNDYGLWRSAIQSAAVVEHSPLAGEVTVSQESGNLRVTLPSSRDFTVRLLDEIGRTLASSTAINNTAAIALPSKSESLMFVEVESLGRRTIQKILRR